MNNKEKHDNYVKFVRECLINMHSQNCQDATQKEYIKNIVFDEAIQPWLSVHHFEKDDCEIEYDFKTLSNCVVTIKPKLRLSQFTLNIDL